jgi:ribonuclease R
MEKKLSKNLKEKILELVDADGTRNNATQLIQLLQLDERKSFDQALDALLLDGEVVLTSKKKVVRPEVLNLYVGELEIKRRGFGFVRMPEDDIFVPRDDLMGAFDGEKVMVKLKKSTESKRSREGYVVKILGDKPVQIIGTFEKSQSFSFVLPDDSGVDDIYISKSKTKKAKNGQKVIVKITKRVSGTKSAEGSIVEVLGYPGDKGVDILSVIRRYGINVDFKNESMIEAKLSANEKISLKEINSRRDLRNETVFTIDGADAKDLDDAVSIIELKNGNMLLGVHIADVTHYVKKGSCLDREAANRATSVYLVDKVVPMLPAVLSNGVCSLSEKVDRLTLSCNMEIDKNGKLVNHEVYKSIIHSNHRMTYSDVNRILEDEDTKLIRKYKTIYKPLLLLSYLAKTLRDRREKSGSIDFDIAEAHIKTDENGRVTQIVPRERGTAEKLIEECMLMANKTVAQDFSWRELPFVYRVHDVPDGEKVLALSHFLTSFGIRLKAANGQVHPKQFQQILRKIKGEKHENIISKVILRSLKKAEYHPENQGHFGLAFEYYCHFTSPIRRYPDFTIHRMIKDAIDGKINEDNFEALQQQMADVSKQSSLMERRAMEAERSVEDIKKCEFIKGQVGESFVGVVSGVTRSAIFVELDNTIEGVLPLSSLKDDYYDFVEKMHCIIGERTRKKISLGDEINVVLRDVNVVQTRIEFGVE